MSSSTNKGRIIFAAVAAAGFYLQSSLADGVHFDHAFAPQEGLVSRYEEPERQEICLNGLWRFQGDQNTGDPGNAGRPPGDWEKTSIKIPSPWNVNSFSMDQSEEGGDFRTYPSYPQAWEKLPAAWMRRTTMVPRDWTGRRIILHFGAVAGKLAAYVNGHPVGGGFDIFFAQDFDVTPFLRFGEDNEILVKVVRPSEFDHPGNYGRREYLSGSFWGTHIAGIWQDVYLLAEPPVAISNIFVQPLVNQNELRIEATVANHGTIPVEFNLGGTVREWINEAGASVLDAPEVKWKLAKKTSLTLADRPINLRPGDTKTVTLFTAVNGRLQLWSPDAPHLYGLLLSLSDHGKTMDIRYQRFGWRQFTISSNQLFLNGTPIVLHGDSWHFMGVSQMTRRYAYAWFRLLKDAGANAVRLHASVYPSFYHDMADEMGIMILDESAIWLSDGGPKADSDLFWRNCRTNVAELVQRDRNHPSVFGWSVCNEILPVLRNVWHAPDSMINLCLDEITVWRNICLTNDPTRAWISGDGEWDANGRLPIINIHYGGDEDLQRAAGSGKPFAVGETSMAYYGTPKQVSKFNGNRAYESDLGRMEGLAYECYGLLASQQKYGANYRSVFNIVWYGVQPLPLGKRDLTRPIALDEGIFFGTYREGQPGMQPERLGPYTTTLNPGYDPSLPLYRPWPMFEAIRDANTENPHSPWAKPPPLENTIAPSVPATTKASISYLPDNGNRLVQNLNAAGIKPAVYSPETPADFLLVDGSQVSEPGAAAEELKSAMKKMLRDGKTVWIWNINPSGAQALGKLLGQDLSAAPRVASSFVVGRNDPLLAGLDNASFYFSEDDDWKQMSYGLAGDFVKGGNILLAACPADWRKWNYQSEAVKTAALFRSELETPGPRTVIVTHFLDRGNVILCNLDPEVDSTHKLAVLDRLFQNEGIRVEPILPQNGFLDLKGRLVRALVCGSFGWTNLQDAYSGQPPTGNIAEGAQMNGRRWKMQEAAHGVFDFKKGLVTGPEENSYAYVAIWIKSPKPLNDLLSEPNLPKLAFTYGSDDGCELFLNGNLLAQNNRHGPLDPEMFTQNPLLLKLGWNQMLIKVVQLNGDWKFAGRFSCPDPAFLSKLEFAARKPAN